MLRVSLEHDAPPLALDLDLPLGELSAIVGPSGSGKTSILRAMAGLLHTRWARVSLDGETWANTAQGVWQPARLRPLGFVGQSYALFPHLNAGENVAAALLHLPTATRRERALACLATVGIAGLAERRPLALSGGQRQRVAMARAIAREPKLLLLDEPFSALDRSTRKRLHIELKRLQASLGVTVVLVTHDLDEAAQLSGHLCLLHHGRLLQQGPTHELLRRPASVESARLLDFPNLCQARLTVSVGGSNILQWGELKIETSTAIDARPGASVPWTIRASDVFLVKAGHSDEARLGTIVTAQVAELIELGDSVLVSLSVENGGGETLRMRLRPGAVRRHDVSPGALVRVALHPEAVIPLIE